MLLLSNAAATGATAIWPGGRGLFTLEGTLGGATVALQVKGPNGTMLTAVKADGGTAAALTAAGCMVCDLAPGEIQATVTGGTPSGLYARFERIPR